MSLIVLRTIFIIDRSSDLFEVICNYMILIYNPGIFGSELFIFRALV